MAIFAKTVKMTKNANFPKNSKNFSEIASRKEVDFWRA